MHDIITIGAATIDAFTWSKAFQTMKSSKFSTGMGECFALGSKIDISRLEIATGGGATNAAATFAHLGFRTSCVTRIGKDLFGDGIFDDLRRRGIGTGYVVHDLKEHTAFSTILVMPSGERTVLVFRGASEHFTPRDIPNLKAKWLYVTNMAGRLEVMKKIVVKNWSSRRKPAFGRGLTSATPDAASPSLFWNPGAADLRHGLTTLTPLLNKVDVFDLNRDEAAMLTGLLPDRLDDMIKKLSSVCPGTILITDGDRGAYAGVKGKILFAQPTGVKAVNRTGAGDAFGSGFVAGMMKWGSARRALQLASVNAESVIQKIGAKAGLLGRWPTTSQLEKIRVTPLTPLTLRGESRRPLPLR